MVRCKECSCAQDYDLWNYWCSALEEPVDKTSDSEFNECGRTSYDEALEEEIEEDEDDEYE